MLLIPIIREKDPVGASGVATATVNRVGFFSGTILPAEMGITLDRYRTDAVVAETTVYTEFDYRVAFAIITAPVTVAFLSSI